MNEVEPFCVLVFGSRTFTATEAVETVLDGLLSDHGRLLVVHGAAKGADRLAHTWAASKRNVGVAPFPAKWSEHGDGWCPGEWCQQRHYCVGAGPRRNAEMLAKVPSIEAAFGFVDKPLAESKGSADMARRCEAAGIETFVVQVP